MFGMGQIFGRRGASRGVSSINPIGKRPVRGSGCYLGRRQLASLDRRISTGNNPSRGASC
jgi:hypothetical protein